MTITTKEYCDLLICKKLEDQLLSNAYSSMIVQGKVEFLVQGTSNNCFKLSLAKTLYYRVRVSLYGSVVLRTFSVILNLMISTGRQNAQRCRVIFVGQNRGNQAFCDEDYRIINFVDYSTPSDTMDI
jgi:hypothetical protein